MLRHRRAKIADVIRSSRRDDTFINELQTYLTSIVNLCGLRNQKFLTPMTTAWYYLLTTLSNLQTLGEEYTSTLRLDRGYALPKNDTKLLWFLLYIGGESLYDKILATLERRMVDSVELRADRKSQIIKLVRFLKANRTLLVRLHHSIFYLNGKYHSISKRLAGVKYVSLRRTVSDDDDVVTNSFYALGVASTSYVLFLLGQSFFGQSSTDGVVYSTNKSTGKTCVLCVETRRDACATSCGHVFCWSCVYDCLKYQQTCPVCREDIKPSRIVRLQNYE